MQKLLSDGVALICGPPGREWWTAVIEWQKRGLPHVHLLLRCKGLGDHFDLDPYVSAVLPDNSDPELARLVRTFMTHGHGPACGDGVPCKKGFPKAVREESTWDDSSGRPLYRRPANSTMVVPYNAQLLKAWQGHANVEASSGSKSISYLLRYQHKGMDKASFREILEETSAEYAAMRGARYLSSMEAGWRLSGFPIVSHDPGITTIDIWAEQERYHQKMRFTMRKPRKTWNLMELWFRRGATAAELDPVTYFETNIVTQKDGAISVKPRAGRPRYYRLRNFGWGTENFYCSVVLRNRVALTAARLEHGEAAEEGYRRLKSDGRGGFFPTFAEKIKTMAPEMGADEGEWTRLFWVEEARARNAGRGKRLRWTFAMLCVHHRWGEAEALEFFDDLKGDDMHTLPEVLADVLYRIEAAGGETE